MKKNDATLELSRAAMTKYGYEVVDAIVEHFDNQHNNFPVAAATRQEMDKLFLEEAPETGTDAHEVLDFVLNKVMTTSAIVSHPKSYSFVP